MSPPPVTYLAMAAIAAATLLMVLGFDVWAWLAHGRHATISHGVFTLAREWPILPLAVGILLGHLFW